MHPDSLNKTCTNTPLGSFVWDYLPFGFEIRHSVCKDLSIKLHRILTSSSFTLIMFLFSAQIMTHLNSFAKDTRKIF